MKILVGYSIETSHNKWEKADVEVSEEDIKAILADSQVDPRALEEMSIIDKFKLLSAEAEISLARVKVIHKIFSSEDQERLDALSKMQAGIIKKLKDYVPY